jgi:hypothetical protein
MVTRYHMKPGREGYTVYDIWTGEAVCVALMPQTGLSLQDAEDLVELMNSLTERGDRLVHQ